MNAECPRLSRASATASPIPAVPPVTMAVRFTSPPAACPSRCRINPTKHAVQMRIAHQHLAQSVVRVSELFDVRRKLLALLRQVRHGVLPRADQPRLFG